MSDMIQLLTVENTLSRSRRPGRQRLRFQLLVANLGYEKQVEVVWAGDDGAWRTLPARYLGERGDGREYWQATLSLSGGRSLPGAVRFAVCLRCQGQEYWDNNADENYTSLPNTGIQLAWPLAVQNLSFDRSLTPDQQWANLHIATNNWFAADSVSIHWSTDGWQHVHHTHCHPAVHSRRGSSRLWTAQLHIGHAFRVEYAICADNGRETAWDNDFGHNYRLSRRPLTVMILNLHCYQEDRQQEKFAVIARAIDEQDVDVVCFQEVAEYWNDGHGDWGSNSANLINQQLPRPMHLHADWSHIGFDIYREGVAILSRYPLQDCQARYVSASQNVRDIHSRKVVMAGIDVPALGRVNIFSAHLSWWEDGFHQQFQQLAAWADSQGTADTAATLLCGDFNIVAGSMGYRQVVEDSRYDDQFLAANAQGLFERIFRVNDPHWRDYPADDYRIDYIFMNRDSRLRVATARVLFSAQDYGRVSDHCGYLMRFEPQ